MWQKYVRISKKPYENNRLSLVLQNPHGSLVQGGSWSWIPIMDQDYGSQLWTPIMDPDFGSQSMIVIIDWSWLCIPIIDPDYGCRIRITIMDPDYGTWILNLILDPKLWIMLTDTEYWSQLRILLIDQDNGSRLWIPLLYSDYGSWITSWSNDVLWLRGNSLICSLYFCENCKRRLIKDEDQEEMKLC